MLSPHYPSTSSMESVSHSDADFRHMVDDSGGVLTRVPLSSLQLSDRLSPLPDDKDQERIRSLALSISTFGLITPPLVDRNLKIISGQHRIRVLQVLFKLNDPEFSEFLATVFPNQEILVRKYSELDIDEHRESVLLIRNQSKYADQKARTATAKSYITEIVKRFGDDAFAPGRPTSGPRPPIAKECYLQLGISESTFWRYLETVRKRLSPDKVKSIPSKSKTPKPPVIPSLSEMKTAIESMPVTHQAEVLLWLVETAKGNPDLLAAVNDLRGSAKEPIAAGLTTIEADSPPSTGPGHSSYQLRSDLPPLPEPQG